MMVASYLLAVFSDVGVFTNNFLLFGLLNQNISASTVLPAKSDSDIIFVYKVSRDL